jgi:hypothetical protein
VWLSLIRMSGRVQAAEHRRYLRELRVQPRGVSAGLLQYPSLTDLERDLHPRPRTTANNPAFDRKSVTD